jgi:uncharacterized membrane protein
MTSYALLFTLAAIGISETVYLIKKRKKEEVPVCFIGENCHTVLTSAYNKTLGIHNDVLGLLFYITVAVSSALLVIGRIDFLNLVASTTKIIILAAALVSFYLTFLQWKVIRAWCFWCLMSAFTTWAMLLIVLVSYWL